MIPGARGGLNGHHVDPGGHHAPHSQAGHDMYRRRSMSEAPATGSDLPKLSAPARRALAAAGYVRLEQLTGVSEAELEALHGMGPKAMRALRDALEQRGLSFRT